MHQDLPAPPPPPPLPPPPSTLSTAPSTLDSSDEGYPTETFRLPSEYRRPNHRKSKGKGKGIGFRGKGKSKVSTSPTPIKEEPESPTGPKTPPAPIPFRYIVSPTKNRKAKGRREVDTLMRDSWSAEQEAPPQRPVRNRQPPREYWKVGGSKLQPSYDLPSDEEEAHDPSDNHEDDSPAPSGGAQNVECCTRLCVSSLPLLHSP
ncbi:hypothetical protein M407DRAFT_33104 [Tulasnella calospora MUT 4182]|uniref:Uncharacterized protein n=1 Tax=Tulasnella calospora MUT 4182 TaxID=1051891 RepID=A0A0C3K761_9AGAM|nr:hypothetical protein M407DRAFT_33104 [Tulasnella calospora MUT 4182]